MPLRLPELTPCYFCEIVAGRIHQWGVIEQAALTLAILNGRQYEIGQCIVFPRRHAPTLLDLTGEEAKAVIAAAQRLASRLRSPIILMSRGGRNKILVAGSGRDCRPSRRGTPE
jgi:diadenosine tetraphosphate (Ap4A) HIT family hydrolase